VRDPADAPSGGRVEPVVLDVTSEDAVAALAERLAGTTLDGLVNNADLVVSGPSKRLTPSSGAASSTST
jgi:short-subunit dehydrogenase